MAPTSKATGEARATLAEGMPPWDGRAYDAAMPLADIGQLLPYHSRVNPGVVVQPNLPAVGVDDVAGRISPQANRYVRKQLLNL